MDYYGDDGYDYHRRRRSPRGFDDLRGRQQYLSPVGGGLHRTRSTGHAPQPVINNIYMDQISDAHMRNESSYPRTPSPYVPPVVAAPNMAPPTSFAVPYPVSPEPGSRSRERYRDTLMADLDAMDIRDRMRSRSRGRTEGSLMDRPDFAEWRLEQKEREIEEERQRSQWQRDMELQRLKDEAKREKKQHDEEEMKKRTIAEYEEKQRRDAERAKAEKERMRQEIEREKREAKEKEEREWQEFLRKQKEKEDEEKRKKKEEKEKFEKEMRERLRNFGYTEKQIDIMVDEEKAKKWKEQRTETTEVKIWKENRAPVYPKVHRDYLSVDTLIYYDIPYEFDKHNRDYIIILRELDKYETEVLFEHTKRLRSGKLLIEAPKKEKEYAWYHKRDRSTSRVRKVGILEYKKVA
ncbi:hypothetical protein M433DRAFT_153764 [Acidomyces richmondensis BFW]|nr:MAG: hypothetical protein FE78DRAFT_89609 [Acidomyces sp. 'richmondensis']KYG46098.1 hypothetical protein M433DRAFT_153764 [Acidomyces richmondensis BFW]